MQRMLCSVLSLAIILSSLGACTTAPVRPAVEGPQVYGYTLNQPLSREQVQRLTDTGKHYIGPLKLYQQVLPDGSQFDFYTDYRKWLDTLARTSREFPAESDCQAAQQADQMQLTTLIDDFNARQARPAGVPRQVGEVYAVRALDACQRVAGQGPGAQAFRYTLWATLQTETAAHEHDFQRKVEDPHAQARDITQAILLLPFVALGAFMGGGCTDFQSQPDDGDGYCARQRAGASK
ncbi:hypothetical protein SAMN05216178_1035 [Pseudomonas saponiphila]|uniref:Lipoprotein n=1 Tax=Pseudomonas saponiphila TaxID=556534 RepID=A0A1H4K4B0_9PSED|nr:hypothetical protein [Pseudomonas saponiphila]SEB53360.1 hypothetical protein SAMN05216178_1035 [Pseudomonas saponiphila]